MTGSRHHADTSTESAGSNSTMVLTVPALPSNIRGLRKPPMSERSNDGSSVMGPKEYSESEPAVPVAGTTDTTESIDQATLVTPGTTSDAKAAVEIFTPLARLTSQNLAKYQDAISSTTDQALLHARNFLAAEDSNSENDYRERMAGIVKLLVELVEEKQTYDHSLYKEVQHQVCVHVAKLPLLMGGGTQPVTSAQSCNGTQASKMTWNKMCEVHQRAQREERAGDGFVDDGPTLQELARPLDKRRPSYVEATRLIVEQVEKAREDHRESADTESRKLGDLAKTQDVNFASPGRYPTPAKSNEELSEAPERPAKQAPAAGHSLPAVPMSSDSPMVKPARRLPPGKMRSRDVVQGLRERKLGMGGVYLLPGRMKKSNTVRNLEPLEQAPGIHTNHRRNEEQLLLAETPYLQAALSRQIDMDLASDDAIDEEQGALNETIPATIQFALPTPTPEEQSKAQVYYQPLNLKVIDDPFLPIRVVSNKRKASDGSDVRQKVGKRPRRGKIDDEGYCINDIGRATEKASVIEPNSSPDEPKVSFIPEMSGALQDAEVSQGEVWQST